MIVEDGSIVTNSDTYITLVDAQALLTARGESTVLTEAILYKAMDYLNGLTYCGLRTDRTLQALPFPRSHIYLSDSRLLASDQIPQELINAQVWAAFYIEAGTDPSAVATQAIKKEKVDVLEVEYQETSGGKSSVSSYDMPNVKSNLKHLVCSNSGYIGRA